MKTKIGEQHWRKFIELVLKCKTKNKLDELFHLFLTMNEREYIASRYCIVEALLTTEETQRVIASKLNVSITKITDGSKAVQVVSDSLRKFLKKEMLKNNL